MESGAKQKASPVIAGTGLVIALSVMPTLTIMRGTQSRDRELLQPEVPASREQAIEA
jgi:hypothetical protein